MAVVKSGEWWYFEWRIGGKSYRRTSGIKIDQASRESVRSLEAAAKQNLEAELKRKGILRDPGGVPRWEEAVERMYREVWSKRKDSEGPLQRCRIIGETIGNPYISRIGPDQVATLKEELFERGITGSTVNRYLAALSAVLNRAQRVWEAIDRVPYIPKEDERGNERTRVVTWGEERAILEACAVIDPDFGDYYRVMVDTGIRAGESLSLSYARDVDFGNNAIVIQSRNTKARLAKGIPMTERVREILERRQRDFRDVGPFRNYHRYEPLYRLGKVLTEAGLEPKGDIVVHSFRHTFASRLANNGVPIYDVSKLLGHSSVTVTERTYGHLFIDRLRETMFTLDESIKKHALV